MNRVAILALLVGSWLCGSSAQAQGTLAHIAVGGGWQTTITLINLSVTPDTAQVSLYSDSGAPLVVTPLGQSQGSQFPVPVPANGSASLVLPGSGGVTTGWARVETTNGAVLRGQAFFLYQPPGGTPWLGTSPLTISPEAQNACIIPLPPPTTGTILIPFDNTANQATGFAISNVTKTAEPIAISFVDDNNTALQTDTLNLGPMTHQSFVLTDRYPGLVNQKGTVRITATADQVAALALLFNNGALTTLLPIYQ